MHFFGWQNLNAVLYHNLDNLSKQLSFITLSIPETEGNCVISRNDKLRSKVGQMSVTVCWLVFLYITKLCRFLKINTRREFSKILRQKIKPFNITSRFQLTM